jgi:hypothetical protein
MRRRTADHLGSHDLLSQPVERASRVVALRLLETVEDERRRLDDADDPEALHNSAWPCAVCAAG